MMDFPGDPQALDIGDEYMFGPAFLVSPVTTYRARRRPVYLPATPGGWFDAWTGAHRDGGQTIEVDAPYDQFPVHVRAGSIVPLGPGLRYTGERPANPVTLLVYADANGRFTLYEDDGLTYAYERGASTRIQLAWDEATGTLTIGAREGTFQGMLAERAFEVVLVSRGAPAGLDRPGSVRRLIAYGGQPVSVRMRD
jgi:alpha-D-xyloside xylohydrolase